MSIWSQDPNSRILCVHSLCVGLESGGIQEVNKELKDTGRTP